ILQAAFIYAPFMHSIFASLPLESSDLLLGAGTAILIMPAIGLEKWIRARVRKGREKSRN
ncbi:MAG: hypothetical protein V2I36_18480, partial [Desulfopila sp.]|nr:hypothetical protein [Desulfopila sp.]